MVERVGNLIQTYFDVVDGVLTIQAHSITDLAEQFGTPFFVYDQSVMESSLGRLKLVFGDEFSIFYSLKANPDPRVIRFFADHASGIEVASAGEFTAALAAGCPAEKILFAGPGKSDSELRQTMVRKIGELHAESVSELNRINRISESLAVQQKVCLRINPSEQVQGGAMRMGGVDSPFGMDENLALAVVDSASQWGRIDICGIHLFAGTQILDAAVLAAQYDRFIHLADSISEKLSKPLDTIDFGGGLGVPCFPGEKPLDMGAVSATIDRVLSRLNELPLLANSRRIIEPGRFLTAEAGVYVTRVIDIKDSGSTRFVIADGGMNHHLAATGNLGQVIKKNYPIACLNRLNDPDTEKMEIVGPLCTPLDRWGRGVEMPDLRAGDLLGIFCSGAYARSASPLGFLSHPAPAEIYLADGEVSVSRICMESR